jgi:hypothetical protein
MKRPYSEHDLAAARRFTIAVLAVVILCTAAILNGWPL